MVMTNAVVVRTCSFVVSFMPIDFLPLLDLQYPGSCFIYNTRDVHRWVDSRMNHRNGKYARTYIKRMQRAFEDSSPTMDDLRIHWHEAWQRHDAFVRHYGRSRASCALPFFASTGLPHPWQCVAPSGARPAPAENP